MSKVLAGFLAAISALSLQCAHAAADVYPSKPVRLIVPFTPGTGIDILSRAIGQRLQDRWGRSVVVENRPGASGNIGTDAGAKAPSDGHTLVMTVNTLAINAGLYNNLPYDPVKDFAPVGRVAFGTLGLTVIPSVPANSVKEFVAMAKAQPGGLFYGSPGNGTPHHLAMELLKSATGINLVHVPYKGSAGMVADMLGGHISIMFLPVHVAIPHVKSGKLRVLAVSTTMRSPVAPDVPTIAESGVQGYEVDMWYGLLAPAGTPKEIIAQINADVAAVLSMPDVRDTLTKQGLEPAPSSPEQFAALIKTDIAKWAKVIRDAGIRAD